MFRQGIAFQIRFLKSPSGLTLFVWFFFTIGYWFNQVLVCFCPEVLFCLTLITEESSPSFLTVTFPWLLARTVLTRGVFLTLGAERSLPALSAPATPPQNGARHKGTRNTLWMFTLSAVISFGSNVHCRDLCNIQLSDMGIFEENGSCPPPSPGLCTYTHSPGLEQLPLASLQPFRQIAVKGNGKAG